MNSPTPALVAQRAAQRMPRYALLLLCAAYVLPGLFGRDPWRNADLTAFGYMFSVARGIADPLTPSIASLHGDGAVLPYWLGAVSIHWLSPWIDAAMAARVPFALLLIGVIACTWWSSFHLARTDAAQPLPFAFGGEAQPDDYARAIADGAVLALLASLGLLQLGHETTPELMQLFGTALFMLGLSASPKQPVLARTAVLVSLPMLAASGAPTMAFGFAIVGLATGLRSRYPATRALTPWLALSTLLALGIGTAVRAWAWRLSAGAGPWQMLQLVGWFMWPGWALAGWTLWRWRSHVRRRHIAVPLGIALVALLAAAGMGASDRALMLGLPATALLAAFALPTLGRAVAAAVDWFSVALFSAIALTVWVVYASLQLGVPAKPAANIARLAPGFVGSFSGIALAAAVAGTVAWLLLVRWRTGRHRHPLWKSLVLPASGLTLCWLLLMTLGLPVLDYARSYRPLVAHVAQQVPHGACIVASGLPLSQLAALEYHGGWRVDARPGAAAADHGCAFLLTAVRSRATDEALARPGWTLVARERRPTERDEQTAIYRRASAPSAP